MAPHVESALLKSVFSLLPLNAPTDFRLHSRMAKQDFYKLTTHFIAYWLRKTKSYLDNKHQRASLHSVQVGITVGMNE